MVYTLFFFQITIYFTEIRNHIWKYQLSTTLYFKVKRIRKLEIEVNIRKLEIEVNIRKLEFEVNNHFIPYNFSLISFSCSLKV